MRSQRALGPDGCVQRVGDALEDDEEAVALGTHLAATGAREGVPQDRALRREHRRVRVAQPREQPGGTLDVAEEEGHGALREVDLHVGIITATARPAHPPFGWPPQPGSPHRVHGEVRTPISVVTICRCANGRCDIAASPRSRGGPIGVRPDWNTGVISIDHQR